MTMTEAEAQEELGQPGHPGFGFRMGFLSPLQPPFKLSISPRPEVCLYTSLGLALTPPPPQGRTFYLLSLRGRMAEVSEGLRMAGIFHFSDYLPWDSICSHRGSRRINPTSAENSRQCHPLYSSWDCTERWQWLGLCSESRRETEGLAQSQRQKMDAHVGHIVKAQILTILPGQGWACLPLKLTRSPPAGRRPLSWGTWLQGQMSSGKTVSPGALEKGSPGAEAHSSAEGEETGLRPPLLLSVLAAEGKESAES